MLDVADRITVLRRGEKVDTVPREGSTERSLARLMVGRDVLLRVEKDDDEAGRAAADSSSGVSARDDRGLPAVNIVDLEVRAGEIVGLAGIDANGQSELIETIMGLRKPDAGEVMVAGRDVTHAGPRATLAVGRQPHRRGPPPARPRARVRPWPRTSACASTRRRPSRSTASSSRRRWWPARAGC